MYGMPYSKFKKLPNSKQERVKFEWDLDNDAENIAWFDRWQEKTIKKEQLSLPIATQAMQELDAYEVKYGYIRGASLIRLHLNEQINSYTKEEERK